MASAQSCAPVGRRMPIPLVALMTVTACASGDGPQIAVFEVRTEAVSGAVPEAADIALEASQQQLMQQVAAGAQLAFEVKPAGRQGQRALCVRFEDPSRGGQAWLRIEPLVRGVAQVKLTELSECP